MAGKGGGQQARSRPAEGLGRLGTLEPCLDKTSHSPLVRATSSLMGHLNSSVRKQSRGEEAGSGQARGTEATGSLLGAGLSA